MTNFNEADNRVDIGVANAAAVTDVQNVVLELGLSKSAVKVSVERMASMFQTLQDNVPPIRGGMGIATNAFATYECSITPPISQYTGPYSPIYDDVVLTNSHCTTTGNSLGANGGDDFYQAGRYIGHEISDAAASSSLPGCPCGWVCRCADLAVISVGSQFSPDDPWRLNTIANTGAPHAIASPPFPITIVDQDTVVSMDATYLPMGAVLRKQGAYSGTSRTDDCIAALLRGDDAPQLLKVLR